MSHTPGCCAHERLLRFFDGAARLSPEQVRALCGGGWASTTSHLGFGVHPHRLAAVTSGRWTREHDELANQAHSRARDAAARLAPLGRRRLLAVVLEDAALAVIADELERQGHPVLSDELRTQLAAPWRTALGDDPGVEHPSEVDGGDRRAMVQ